MAEEERAKTSEEKFLKLKNMYTQIRDEHIKLLRQVITKILLNNTENIVFCVKSNMNFKLKQRYYSNI